MFQRNRAMLWANVAKVREEKNNYWIDLCLLATDFVA